MFSNKRFIKIKSTLQFTQIEYAIRLLTINIYYESYAIINKFTINKRIHYIAIWINNKSTINK